MSGLRKIQEQLMLFFSLPKSKIIQWYFSSILVKKPTAKMNSIPFTQNDVSQSLGDSCRSPTKNQRLHIVQGITKNRTATHNLPKSIHKIQLKLNPDNKKSDLRLMNLPFTSAVKNCTQQNKFWEERQTCHAVPVLFHYKKGEQTKYPFLAQWLQSHRSRPRTKKGKTIHVPAILTDDEKLLHTLNTCRCLHSVFLTWC